MMEDLSHAIAELREDVRELKRQRGPPLPPSPPPGPPPPPPDALELLANAAAMVEDLKEENRQLRLAAFWDKFNAASLLRAIMIDQGHPQCKCDICSLTGRLNGGRLEQAPKECTYRAWIRKKVSDAGMTLSEKQCTDKTLHTPSSGFIYVSEEDAHFAASHETRLGITFAAKLWKAQSVEDPELEKLVGMFAMRCGVDPLDQPNVLVEMLGDFKYNHPMFALHIRSY
jgi:hypothetical protein